MKVYQIKIADLSRLTTVVIAELSKTEKLVNPPKNQCQNLKIKKIIQKEERMKAQSSFNA